MILELVHFYFYNLEWDLALVNPTSGLEVLNSKLGSQEYLSHWFELQDTLLSSTATYGAGDTRSLTLGEGYGFQGRSNILYEYIYIYIYK